jgi:formate dehydrogenase major subunit/formate dehydrogenase alpha subunit
MSNTFEDIANHARGLLVIGSNLTEQHPVLGARIRQAVLRRKVKMVVANPDFVNIEEYAALSICHRLNTETALLNGLMNIILEKGWQDNAFIEKHPTGFNEFRAIIANYTPQRVSDLTSVSIENLYRAAEILASNRPMAVLWSSGLAHPIFGRGNIHSLANLQMLLGNLNVPGGGVNPLRPQNNIQGACDMGALPDMLPGYQPLSHQESRLKFERAWGVTLPSQAGLPASQILDAVGQQRIKALYILGEEILNTTAAGARVRRNLNACDFVVLQEIMSSEITRYADVLLPGTSFAEKSGTFTNSERRIQMVRKAIEPIGDARPDWQVITELAHFILAKTEQKPKPSPSSGWEYADTAQIMQEAAKLSHIYAGVSQERLLHGERLHWPVKSPEHLGTSILSAGFFSGGELRWVPVEQTPMEKEEEYIPILQAV